MNKLRILLTGTNGFVGKQLVLQLKRQGHELFFITRKPVIGNHEFFWDYHTNLPILPEVDVIMHLAAYVRFDQDFNAELYQVNTQATIKLANYARQKNVCLIFTSSAGVHGTKGRFNSQSPIAPAGHYAVSKWLAEEYIKQSLQNWIIIRISGVYGLDGPAHLGLNHSLSEAYHKKIIPTIYGTGTGRRNYILVSDLVNWLAYLCGHKALFIRQMIYMSSPEILTIREYLQSISRILVDNQPLKENSGNEGFDMIVEPSDAPVALTVFEDYLQQLKQIGTVTING